MPMTFFGPFMKEIWKKTRHGYFMQNDSKAYIDNYSINVLNNMLEDRSISHIMWLARSPD
jgi:hypothetical protein